MWVSPKLTKLYCTSAFLKHDGMVGILTSRCDTAVFMLGGLFCLISCRAKSLDASAGSLIYFVMTKMKCANIHLKKKKTLTHHSNNNNHTTEHASSPFIVPVTSLNCTPHASSSHYAAGLPGKWSLSLMHKRVNQELHCFFYSIIHDIVTDTLEH